MFSSSFGTTTPTGQNSGPTFLASGDANGQCQFVFGASAGNVFGGPTVEQTVNNITKDTLVLLPEEALESCKCEYCKCYISVGPVRMVENKIACGRCRRECEGVRLVVVEALAKQFHYPCRYKNLGCKQVLKWKTMDAHEKVCDFKEIRCTIESCDWTGAKSALISHFDKKHAREIISSQKGVTINLTEKKISNFLYTWKNKVFMITLSNDGDKIDHQVKYFCTSIEACMYIYDICIYDSEKKLMYLNQKLQSFDDELDLLNSELCIDKLQCVFVNSANVNILFQIKCNRREPGSFSVKDIECPICLKPMLGNIMIGSCGHSFCENCKKSLQNCPFCRAAFAFPHTVQKSKPNNQDIRNYFLENVIKKLSIEL